tara:strand:+ start:33195 stop:34097 length:903 start_codon:yes stop_codon:yes gene_type:complete
MNNIIALKSVADAHSMIGLEKPTHPLISVVKNRPQKGADIEGMRIVSDLYIIALKENLKCILQYGRNSYDYGEGTLVFISPGQVIIPSKTDEPDLQGWSLVFHPDLIQKSNLGNTISKYSFFDYDICEALHLSEKEKFALKEFVSNIEDELNGDVDKHSMDIIIHNLESILKYSHRFYDRQYVSRSHLNKDYISGFEKYLKYYFDSNQHLEFGIPTIDDCGKAMNMSGKYLSDFMKRETGKSLMEHIHVYLINKAKAILLNSNESIGQVAYSLGFKYPQHFSKFFKVKTGFNPSDYRKIT